MRFGVGGLTKPMCDLLDNNQVDVLLDTQDFDLDAVESVKDIRHFRISAGEYADPFNKGAVVNKLDFVILAALEVDVNFNCNVVVGSDGVITGAQGGHPDTAAGAKCTVYNNTYRDAPYGSNNSDNTGRICRCSHHGIWSCS